MENLKKKKEKTKIIKRYIKTKQKLLNAVLKPLSRYKKSIKSKLIKKELKSWQRTYNKQYLKKQEIEKREIKKKKKWNTVFESKRKKANNRFLQTLVLSNFLQFQHKVKPHIFKYFSPSVTSTSFKQLASLLYVLKNNESLYNSGRLTVHITKYKNPLHKYFSFLIKQKKVDNMIQLGDHPRIKKVYLSTKKDKVFMHLGSVYNKRKFASIFQRQAYLTFHINSFTKQLKTIPYGSYMMNIDVTKDYKKLKLLVKFLGKSMHMFSKENKRIFRQYSAEYEKNYHLIENALKKIQDANKNMNINNNDEKNVANNKNNEYISTFLNNEIKNSIESLDKKNIDTKRFLISSNYYTMKAFSSRYQRPLDREKKKLKKKQKKIKEEKKLRGSSLFNVNLTKKKLKKTKINIFIEQSKLDSMKIKGKFKKAIKRVRVFFKKKLIKDDIGIRESERELKELEKHKKKMSKKSLKINKCMKFVSKKKI